MSIKKFLPVSLIAIVLCVFMAVTASAQWWNDNPFDDVSSDAWYYDAVRFTNKLGILNGVSETEFGVNNGMTRAMFVTMLASASGYDASLYTEAPFDDVPAGEWYTAPISWAVKYEFANGTGDGIFSPNKVITRQELVTVLYKYAEKSGYDASVGDTELNGYSDSEAVAGWAAEAMKWAVEKGIISGIAVNGESFLSPDGTATRAQVAVMMTKLYALSPSYTINKNDISQYKIVYSKDGTDDFDIDETAEFLRDYIKLALGAELPVVTDETEPYEYEILVGETNRETAGLVTVDRGSFPDDNYYIWKVQGGRLVISGIDSNDHRDDGSRTTMNIDGTKKAVIAFCEDELGIEFYDSLCVYADPDPVIAFDDGYEHIGKFSFKWHTLLVDGWGVGDCGNYYSEWGCGSPHRLRQVMFGLWNDSDVDFNASNPCFTDQDNIQSLIDNVRYLLDTHPRKNLVGLIVSDSDSRCRCERCMEVYRRTGSRSGTLYLMLKTLADTLADEYPNVKYATWAYTADIVPPKNVEPNDKLVIYFNTLVYCAVHSYDDRTCPLNYNAEEYIRRWTDLAGDFCIWEHTGSFRSYLTPYGNIGIILKNARLFLKYGANGMFLNGTLLSGAEDNYPDFNVMRGYLFDRVYRNTDMSDEEYDYHINGFLRSYFGPGWKYLREYLDRINDLEDSKHHFSHYHPGGAFDYAEVRASISAIDPLWEKAKEGATEEQIFRIENEQLSWIYLKQCALYETEYAYGTDADKAAYVKDNEELYDLIQKHNIPKAISGFVDFAEPPETWQGWTDDY